MRILFVSMIIVVGISVSQAQSGFKQTQQTYKRVRNAYSERGDSLSILLSAFNLEPGEIELHIQVFKMEKVFEIWVRKEGDVAFKKLKSYDIQTSLF